MTPLRDFLVALCPRALVEEARARLSKKHIADLMGLSPSNIDAWRSSKREPALTEERKRLLIDALEAKWREDYERAGRLLAEGRDRAVPAATKQ